MPHLADLHGNPMTWDELYDRLAEYHAAQERIDLNLPVYNCVTPGCQRRQVRGRYCHTHYFRTRIA